nr:hypothetical protein BaRGS_022488 [Batillaria attramentaria]
MQTFYKTFKSELGRPIPVWAKENWSPDQRKKRRQRYGHAHFAEQVIYVFTLLNEDILEALLYLEQRGVVNADITTYNMIVEDLHGTRSQRLHILPSYSFAVKLADLGLARKLPRNATSVHIGSIT